MAFAVPLDIFNRALQHCDEKRLVDVNSPIEGAREILACYDQVRISELQRNLWKFATRRVVLRAIGIDSVLWTPPAWTSASNYPVGTIISYLPTTGPYQGTTYYWELEVAEASASVPPDLDPNFHLYTGPIAIDLYNPQIQYNAGEQVLVPATYSAIGTYALNAVVNYVTAGVPTWYVSLVAANNGNQPDISPTKWVKWTSSGRGNNSFGLTATNSPLPLTYPGANAIYTSLFNSNADNPAGGTANWLNQGGTIVPLQLVWPLNAGPAHDMHTINAFHLPNGFLKRAPTDPKGGQSAYLGAFSGVSPEDWVIEGKYIVSGDAGPIMFRFIANVLDVDAMDAMFCEGLAARLASEVVGAITHDAKQRVILKAAARREYIRSMGEARTANAIEVGPLSPVENRYVIVRQ